MSPQQAQEIISLLHSIAGMVQVQSISVVLLTAFIIAHVALFREKR